MNLLRTFFGGIDRQRGLFAGEARSSVAASLEPATVPDVRTAGSFFYVRAPAASASKSIVSEAWRDAEMKKIAELTGSTSIWVAPTSARTIWPDGARGVGILAEGPIPGSIPGAAQSFSQPEVNGERVARLLLQKPRLLAALADLPQGLEYYDLNSGGPRPHVTRLSDALLYPENTEPLKAS